MSKILRFIGPEVYVSGKGNFTVYTGQSVTIEDAMAENLLNRFPDWFEVVTEDGDVVLQEGNVELNEPFDDLTEDDDDVVETVDEEEADDFGDDEEVEEDQTNAVDETAEPKKRGRKAKN